MIAAADTEGKPSLGWRGRRAAERLSGAVSSALPEFAEFSDARDGDFDELGEKIVHGLQVGAARGRELVGNAAGKSAPLAEAGRRLRRRLR